ncbi:acyl-CoA dehydrogenase family protein [Vibrio sp. Isolate24]|uniref:acyl-CoA dehydrogenase family protein n=1 Tax=Vibrio sp. Isolate24 TaxID=2908534 RepID=UPI001EFE955C|nr:acyl-CoA dehydrogenase family protein [Vibrio sp. Isolate24]MCG9678422.1 acyl-CoA dehydrogenase family protein [Vibrio sp. Isolate24]
MSQNKEYLKIFSALEEVLPHIEPRLNEIEQLRRLPADVAQSLKNTGVFAMNFPRSWGGAELNSMEQTQLIERIAQVDAAVAWCVMIGSDSGIYSGYLEDSVAKKLFKSVNFITAGWIHPQGKAERVEGGYLVTGKWRFGSGISNSDLVSAGCFVYEHGKKVLDEDGQPIWRVMIAKPSEYLIADGWHTTGLQGSGSLDYSANELYVPNEHSFSFSEPYRKGPLHDSPEAILRNMSGVPLGIARAAIDYVRAKAPTKFDRTLSVPWLESSRVQTVIAGCEADLLAARSAVYSSLQQQWHALETSQPLSEELRVATAVARFKAFQTSRDIIQQLYDLVGGASIYKQESPMDKWLRDVNTICQHAVAQQSILTASGELLLTSKSNNPFI